MTANQGLLPAQTKVLACKVLEPELRTLGLKDTDMYFLDQALHRYPQDLQITLQKTLQQMEEDLHVEQVILGYGLCGGGMAGITSRRVTLHVPLIHDCIPLFRDNAQVSKCTFYLTPGWIEHGQTPLTEYEITAEKFGYEDALWVGQQMLKGYKEVVLIQNQARVTDEHRYYARRMATLFGLGYREEQGQGTFLRQVLSCQSRGNVLSLPPGRILTQSDYE